ncbi:Gamete expressed 1 [Carpediemonas membranifera]|uniref:Gamete expressed 1 n=1 Tax=Carpediemonas membranifera TaxID=201153 RepID=A0A8J6B8E2_9EUKA|nr:Gamete expressed 1 [Carpediemonas membranifera]|eukprot:KAG9394862.1 Gamete expressed 1 [Carpediemonas membranifera]
MKALLTFLAILVLAQAIHAYEMDIEAANTLLSSGESLVEEMEEQSVMSPCYKRVFRTLTKGKGCKHMKDHDQQRLAFELANCHLERSGLDTFPCKRSENIARCTQRMSALPIAFDTYTSFFLHLDDLCFFLSQKDFQDEAEKTINRLYDASNDTVFTLAQLHADHSRLSISVRDQAASVATLASSVTSVGDSIEELDAKQTDAFSRSQDRLNDLSDMSARIADFVGGLTESHRVLRSINSQTLTSVNLTSSRVDALANAQAALVDSLVPLEASLKVLTQLSTEAAEDHAEQAKQHKVLEHGIEAAEEALTTSIHAVSSAIADAQAVLAGLTEAQQTLLDGQTQALDGLSALAARQHEEFSRAFISLTQLNGLAEDTQARLESQREMLDDFQHTVLGRVEHLVLLTRRVLGEVGHVRTLLSYVIAATAIYLVTATRRLKDCRIVLLMGLLAVLVVDRFAMTRVTPPAQSTGLGVNPADAIRWVGFTALVVFGVHKMISYNDPAALLNLQIMSIYKKQVDMVTAIQQSLGLPPRVPTPLPMRMPRARLIPRANSSNQAPAGDPALSPSPMGKVQNMAGPAPKDKRVMRILGAIGQAFEYDGMTDDE